MIRFHVDKEKLRELWRTDKTNADIAAELGITTVQLYVAGRKLKLEQRWGHVRRVYKDSVDPTLEEIAERAAEIRAEWPEGEAERRLVGNVVDPVWTMPAFSFDRRKRSFVRER